MHASRTYSRKGRRDGSFTFSSTLTSSKFAGFEITIVMPPSRREVAEQKRKKKKRERFVLMHFVWRERFCQYRCCDRKLLLEDTIWIRGHRGPRCRVELESGPTVTNKLLTLRTLPDRGTTLSGRSEFSHPRFWAIYLRPAMSHKSMIHIPV